MFDTISKAIVNCLLLFQYWNLEDDKFGSYLICSMVLTLAIFAVEAIMLPRFTEVVALLVMVELIKIH